MNFTGIGQHGQETAKTVVKPFDSWLPDVTPSFTWDWKYLIHIRKALHRVTTGECKRLMLFIPPRHGKSEMTTVRYPVWRLEGDPELRIIIGAYNQILANKFSRKARRIAEQRPDLQLSRDRVAVEDWETEAGGGIRAVGVGGGITGQGGQLIIIDDPVKNREEANSETYREKVWDWYTDDLYTRLEPNGAIILIMTRWHEDDLAGRLLAEMDRGGEQWEVVNLPAEAGDNDPLGRAPGDALCPDRYDVIALQRIKAVLGNSYHALYQQTPRPPEGDYFKRAWFGEPVKAIPAASTYVRYWDLAAGTSESADETAGVLMARDSRGYFYVVDVVHGRWAAHERNNMILQTAALDRQKYGSVSIGVEQAPGLSKEPTEDIVRQLAGYVVAADKVNKDKESRAQPLQAQAQAGNVKLVYAAWNDVYLNQLCDFPTGKHDDMVDGSSGAFNKLAESGVGFSRPYDQRTRVRR